MKSILETYGLRLVLCVWALLMLTALVLPMPAGAGDFSRPTVSASSMPKNSSRNGQNAVRSHTKRTPSGSRPVASSSDVQVRRMPKKTSFSER